MMAPGDFIGPYRILAETSRLASSVTYLVEHPVQDTATPLFLTVWPAVHLRSLKEKHDFAQACEQIKRLPAPSFPLLESGVDQETPYILLPEQEAGQERIALIDQQLQKSQSSEAEAVFLRAVQGAPPPRPSWLPGWARAAKEKGSRVPKGAWVGVFAALLIISCCGWVAHVSLPASGATLTVTPKSTHVQQTLFVAVSTQPNQNGDIHGQAITYTTPAQTRTGKATGKAHHAATKATGSVVISNISLNGSSEDLIGASTVASLSGVDIVIDGFTAREGATITVPAHAERAGSGGNISAYDINFTVQFCRQSDVLCNNPTGQAHVQNPRTFTGGHNAFDQTIVQQSDIDTLAQPLIPQLTASAQEQLSQLVAQQKQPDDQAALPTPECTPTIRPNHKISTAATTVTVQVSVTCYQILYAQADFIPGVVHAQEQQTRSKYFVGYRLVGDMLASTPVFATTDAVQQTATLRVDANSIWAYQLDDNDKAMMAEEIVEQTPDAAKVLLLAKFSSIIQDVTFALQGFGGKLPTDAGAIHFSTQPVPGLRA
ncbi:MAG TPA: hypothetical protein VH599_16265 [Ktedonobacterales bacterium]|jgi:hypothetical protein